MYTQEFSGEEFEHVASEFFIPAIAWMGPE
jgi:hypothetical protein